jgi:hypothetical protein
MRDTIKILNMCFYFLCTLTAIYYMPPSEDLASFGSGSDLLQTNGRAWTLPLYGLSSHRSYFPLYAKLREEQLVPDELDAALSTLPSIV